MMIMVLVVYGIIFVLGDCLIRGVFENEIKVVLID